MSNVLPLYRAAPTPAAEPPYPTSCKGSIAFGWTIIAIVFGGFGTWASLAPLSSAAIAPGTVVVDSSRKSLQHLEGGVIREILVRDGDVVEAGEILLRLDGANVRAAMGSLQPMLATNRAYQARLQAERNGEGEIIFPDELLLEAKADIATAQILGGQKRIFETRRNALIGEKALNANRLAQSRQRLEGLERQRGVKERGLAILREELATQKALLSKGYATRKSVASAERSLQQLESEYTELQSKVEEAKMLVQRYELEETQIDKNFVEQVENELYDAEKEYYQLIERMRAIQDQYARLDIRAPVSGVVVNMKVHTVGGVIAPGNPILDIVPQNDKLMIEAQVRPSDVDGVRAGLAADVRFPAFDGTDTPRLQGTVTLVSADRLTNASNGTPYFLARVEVDEEDLIQLKGLSLVPGMPAEVLINKSERTLLNYLLSPIMHGIWTAFRQ
jgi:HlyD family type I secretion membrane fusion protein